LVLFATISLFAIHITKSFVIRLLVAAGWKVLNFLPAFACSLQSQNKFKIEIMKQKLVLILASVLFIASVFIACKKSLTSTGGSTSASITNLNCVGVTYSATATINAAYTATATVPYTGGNAVAYAAGISITSTGVTGLTATLVAGTLANGAGGLTYSISGTPTTSGTAVFGLSFGGQTCSISLIVNPASGGTATITGLTCASVGYSTTAVVNVAYSGTASVPYTGGNGIAYTAGTAIASTGVTGLTATLAAGTLASGAGNLTYNITGTATVIGTANFALSFGGQSCSIALTINSSAPTITGLTCASATYSGNPVSGTAFTGTATVPYTGGNALAYSAGAPVASTGATGLTATLAAGILGSGAGNLTYNISGTASTSGTANFAISFGGQSCSLTLTVSAPAGCASLSGVPKIVCLANAFLATLTTTQQSQVVVALNLTNAKRWSNLPCGLSCRNGILFSSLTSTQQVAALAVIQAASGTGAGEGYDEFNMIRAADDYLGQTASGYSSGNYVIAFLGSPTTTGKWMLQFGGHHYAQNITYDAGLVTSITPLHEAVEPKGSFAYGGTTYAGPMAAEQSTMADMLASFTTAELATAKLSTTFSDCLMVPGSTTNTFPTTKQGIKVSTLSAAAQAKVLAAIAPWVNDLDAASTAAFMTIYQNELANTYVCYASNTGGTSGNASSFLVANTDYVRIDGPSIWIEFICQNGVVLSGIHYHTVMRDHTRDYIGL
jgi:hypothetical protein